MSLESNNRPQLNLITWIPSSKMVRFLNRNWTRNSLLKSWIVFLITIFHWPKFTKTGCKQIASDKNIYFCGSYWRKKKNTNKWRGCCSTSLIPPNLPPPPPPPKKSPITTTTKKHLWCFYLIKQKSNNRYLFQSTSNLNGPKTHNHDQQSGSWQININLVMLCYL